MSFNRTQPWYVRRAYALLERRAARFTDRIVTVADAMIEQSVAAGVAPRERFETVYSGMEVEEFDPARFDRAAVRARWGVGDEHVVIGTVARLFRRKGYEQLLPIMAHAAARDLRLRFVWIGDGAQRPEYERELDAAWAARADAPDRAGSAGGDSGFAGGVGFARAHVAVGGAAARRSCRRC